MTLLLHCTMQSAALMGFSLVLIMSSSVGGRSTQIPSHFPSVSAILPHLILLLILPGRPAPIMTLSGVDMFCFVASIVSVVFVVPPLRNWIASCMPSAKMQELETVLSETEGLLRSALEEGTIDYAHYENNIHVHMWQ